MTTKTNDTPTPDAGTLADLPEPVREAMRAFGLTRIRYGIERGKVGAPALLIEALLRDCDDAGDVLITAILDALIAAGPAPQRRESELDLLRVCGEDAYLDGIQFGINAGEPLSDDEQTLVDLIIAKQRAGGQGRCVMTPITAAMVEAGRRGANQYIQHQQAHSDQWTFGDVGEAAVRVALAVQGGAQ